jgi:hypothetical protein
VQSMIRFARAALALLSFLPTPLAGAQAVPPAVAVLDVALYTAGANTQEAGDTGRAVLATAVLRHVLDSLLGERVADASAVQAQARTSAAAIGGDKACNVVVACARATGGALGARWVVMAKVSKTSNLIWLLSAQLVRVENGQIVLDDSTELKGEPDAMVRLGARIFAERVARTVRAGGYTTNFPQAEAGR